MEHLGNFHYRLSNFKGIATFMQSRNFCIELVKNQPNRSRLSVRFGGGGGNHWRFSAGFDIL